MLVFPRSRSLIPGHSVFQTHSYPGFTKMTTQNPQNSYCSDFPVKNRRPSTVSKIRLISGRNSPIYSFGDSEISEVDPNQLGEKVLAIWNERVTGIRKLYRHVRTIVLIKSSDLLELAAFEFDTIIYPAEQFWWQWNERNNLEGFSKSADQHIFTWQPHGSQFTIIESVPEERLAIKIKEPPQLDRDAVLESIRFDASWVQILK